MTAVTSTTATASFPWLLPQNPRQWQRTEPDPRDPCSGINGFEEAIGRYSASELNDAALTVFGEMGSLLHSQSYKEALGIASEIFNRSAAIANGTQGNNPWGNSSSLSDVVSAQTQFIGYRAGIAIASQNVEFNNGQRNCIRMQDAISAVLKVAAYTTAGLPSPYPFFFNFSNYGGKRPLDPGEVRIGGNDFSVNPMKRYP